jgi:hypothetical protein
MIFPSAGIEPFPANIGNRCMSVFGSAIPCVGVRVLLTAAISIAFEYSVDGMSFEWDTDNHR